MNRICLVLTMLAMGTVSVTQADETPPLTEEQITFFETRIRPVLVEHCYKCHAAEAKIVQGGLKLDHRNGLLKGGDSGPAIMPENAKQSLLLKAMRYEGLEMPPSGRLPEAVVRDFEIWVSMGAPDPRMSAPDSTQEQTTSDAGGNHWAFQPVSNPPRPAVNDHEWSLDPLDDFVLAKLDAAGLKPVADADRYTWLRRVTFDLTGLPPTPEEIELFVRDDSPEAYHAVVDRLLSSRAFGERWARHWLDLTGYADMMGTSNNVFAEHAWRYRDYLIEAYNKDKPYDRFVREQIAGDLLPAESAMEQAENIVATGFLMVGDVEIVEPDKAKLEADHVDTQVNKIGITFLGMTLGCVRCHDHKFDPLVLSDYYGIAGMLRSSPSTHKIPFGVWSLLNSTVLPETPEQLVARQKLEADHEAHLAQLKARLEQLDNDRKAVIAELEQLTRAEQPASSDAAALAMKKEMLAKRRDELSAQLQPLGPAIQHAEFFRSKAPRAFAMSDGPAPSDMPVYIRGNPYAPGSVVPRGVIRIMSWEALPEIPPEQSGRLQLADWLADRRNPLTARVIVNRIWQKLLGEGLVRSVDYFGLRGEQPTHPEMLDHLATRLMDQGWSQKQLIRSIVLSRTYRLSSTNDASAMQIDPDNRLLWRMNRQRLDAEAIRDGLLAVSGELISSTGGPALVLEFPENCGDLVQQGVNPPNYGHRKSRPGQEFQRSIYLPVMRTTTTSLDRIRGDFDFINPAQISGQRSQTVVPTQSLFIMNNDLFRKRAGILAERLMAENSSIDSRLQQLWFRVLNRPITSEEKQNAITFLQELQTVLIDQPESSREVLQWQELCHSLLASNEFIFRI